MNFIKTSDENVAEIYRKEGYQELPQEGKFFVFVNQGIERFSEEVKKKSILTNQLCI